MCQVGVVGGVVMVQVIAAAVLVAQAVLRAQAMDFLCQAQTLFWMDLPPGVR